MENFVEQAAKLVEMGELEQAERVFQEAISLRPDNLHALTGYARVAMLRRDWAGALVRWQNLADAAPDKTRLVSGLTLPPLELTVWLAAVELATNDAYDTAGKPAG